MKNKTLFVFYMTDACDFQCSYCFEKIKNSGTSSREDIRTFVEKSLEEARDQKNLLFILFGGEPLLCFDNIRYFTELVMSKRKDVHFTIYTNGSFFWKNENILKFLNLRAQREKKITLFISYDGVENCKRIKNHKDTTPNTIKVLQKLSALRDKGLVDLGISYTVGPQNEKVLEEDLKNILENFSLSKIEVQFRTNELIDSLGIKFSEENPKDKVQEYIIQEHKVQELYQKFRIPLCNLTCSWCRGCDRSHAVYKNGFKDKVVQETPEDFNDYFKEKILTTEKFKDG